MFLRATVTAIAALLLFSAATGAAADRANVSPAYLLTIDVEGVRNSTGAIGMLLFESRSGWPDQIRAAARGQLVPAQSGRTVVQVNGLPPGEYGVLIVHDENGNRKLDRDWKGFPKEQWGMSNNPRVFLSTPTFDSAKFHLKGDTQIRIVLK